MTNTHWANPQWYVKSPGVLKLYGSDVQICLLDNWSLGFRYVIYWGNREIGKSATLDYAKTIALDWIKEVLEMGLEP